MAKKIFSKKFIKLKRDLIVILLKKDKLFHKIQHKLLKILNKINHNYYRVYIEKKIFHQERLSLKLIK